MLLKTVSSSLHVQSGWAITVPGIGFTGVDVDMALDGFFFPDMAVGL